jgi:hypothetical protein
MNPDTLDWRLRQCLLQWHQRRIMQFNARDPLTQEERSKADWVLSCKREQARMWLRRERALKVAAPNVYLFKRPR